jgi:hypothetical protein
MTAADLLADLTSQDTTRIWSASHAIITSHDLETLRSLAHHVGTMTAATDGTDLGGGLRPNRAALEFAMRKLLFVAEGTRCLCELYPLYDLFDPEKLAAANHVVITAEKITDHTSIYACTCQSCKTRYSVERFDYHYPWWTWQITPRSSD